MESETELKQNILSAILIAVYSRTGIAKVPVSISARHLHLCRNDLEAHFGKGHELHPFKELIQPGIFAAEEKVNLVGPKGRIDNVRVLGPLRAQTQVEISMTDAFKLGIKPEMRLSGDLASSPGIRLETKYRLLDIPSGVIVAQRHLHMTDEEAEAFGLSNGDIVRLKKAGPREIIFGLFVVRAGQGHRLEAHIDTDEANAAAINDGDLLEILR